LWDELMEYHQHLNISGLTMVATVQGVIRAGLGALSGSRRGEWTTEDGEKANRLAKAKEQRQRRKAK